jgi:hypothetical protein
LFRILINGGLLISVDVEIKSFDSTILSHSPSVYSCVEQLVSKMFGKDRNNEIPVIYMEGQSFLVIYMKG